MYKINKVKENGLNYIEIVNSSQMSAAKICLDRGAALESLTLKKESVIVDLHPLEYKNTYASSILFPFANRIKDGEYNYNNKNYKLDCNEAGLNNALHGLVYDKSFDFVDSSVSEQNGSISLVYNCKKINNAFPYLFTIIIQYTLTNNSIDLSVQVKNNDEATFPFTMGWHPYFLSDDLYNSSLNFSTTKEFEFDERMITKGSKPKKVETPFNIKDKQLDNCYHLSNGTIVFDTPKYKMTIESSAPENYFQMYTPPKKNTIALEPVTGISDSFNNKIGIQELVSGEEYQITWKVKVE